jgi:hypothetical protein
MLPNFVPAISTLQSTQLDIKRFAQTVGMPFTIWRDVH